MMPFHITSLIAPEHVAFETALSAKHAMNARLMHVLTWMAFVDVLMGSLWDKQMLMMTL